MMASANHDPRKQGTIWMLNLDAAVPKIVPALQAHFFRAGQDHARALAAAMKADAAEVTTRLESGRRCYAAWVDGKIAAYGWVSFEEEWIGELHLRLRLLPGEVYIWDCATLPAYRQKRLYSALLAYMVGELRADPLCRVWIGANQDNEPSLRGIANAGFLHVADLVVSRVLAMRLAWVQGVPGVPENLVADARRVFLDNRDQVWLAALASTVRA